MRWGEEFMIKVEGKRSHKHICCLHICNAHTLAWSTLLHFYTPYTLRTCIHSYPTHQLLQTYKPTHNQSHKQTYTLHTTLPLHTYFTYLHCPYKPTKPYIPTLPLRTCTTPTTTAPYSACLPYHYTPAP